MYYRGSRVSPSERSPRVAAVGVSYGLRFRAAREEKAKGNQGFFLKWGGKKDRVAAVPERKAHAFYRPGVIPAEGNPFQPKGKRETGGGNYSPFRRVKGLGTPAFSEKKGAWIPKGAAFPKVALGFKLAGLLLLAAAVVWSKNKTTALLQDMAGLRLERVTVDGNRYLSDEAIIKTAALPLGESMFKLDLGGALERLKGMDWIDRVFIERRLPRSIVISVRERQPIALLDNGALYGLDREGRVLSPSPALLKEDLPLVSGVPIQAEASGTTTSAEALKPALDFLSFVAKKDPTLAQDVSEVHLSQLDSVKVTFIDGIEAVFEPPVTESELGRMAMVLSDLNGKGKRAASMDFRYKDMVVVKTR